MNSPFHFLPNARRKPRARGFSLIEIVLAIGIVSFAAMAIVGALPAGLQVVHDARVQAAKANIVGQLRGEFQQISFNDTGSEFSIGDLTNESRYYTADGVPTTATAADVYYEAEFELFPGVADEKVSVAGVGFIDQSNARIIKVTLSYPPDAPLANRQKTKFSLFSSRQTATAY